MESLESIARLNAENYVLAELVEYIRYNICYVTESEYAELNESLN